MQPEYLHEGRFLRIIWDEKTRIIGIEWKEAAAGLGITWWSISPVSPCVWIAS
jgi:hypothetical protein